MNAEVTETDVEVENLKSQIVRLKVMLSIANGTANRYQQCLEDLYDAVQDRYDGPEDRQNTQYLSIIRDALRIF